MERMQATVRRPHAAKMQSTEGVSRWRIKTKTTTSLLKVGVAANRGKVAKAAKVAVRVAVKEVVVAKAKVKVKVKEDRAVAKADAAAKEVVAATITSGVSRRWILRNSAKFPARAARP